MVSNARPRLFIGSSSESLPIVEILTLELKDVAEVVPWNDPRIFPATEFFTTSLLRAATIELPVGMIQSVGDTVLLSVPTLGLRQTVSEADQHEGKVA